MENDNMQLALTYLESGKYTETIALCDSSLNCDDSYNDFYLIQIKALFRMSNMYNFADTYTQAAELYIKAINIIENEESFKRFTENICDEFNASRIAVTKEYLDLLQERPTKEHLELWVGFGDTLRAVLTTFSKSDIIVMLTKQYISTADFFGADIELKHMYFETGISIFQNTDRKFRENNISGSGEFLKQVGNYTLYAIRVAIFLIEQSIPENNSSEFEKIGKDTILSRKKALVNILTVELSYRLILNQHPIWLIGGDSRVYTIAERSSFINKVKELEPSYIPPDIPACY